MKRSVATPFTNIIRALVSPSLFYIGLLHAISSYTYTYTLIHVHFHQKVYLGALLETFVLKSISIMCVHHRYVASITISCRKEVIFHKLS